MVRSRCRCGRRAGLPGAVERAAQCRAAAAGATTWPRRSAVVNSRGWVRPRRNSQRRPRWGAGRGHPLFHQVAADVQQLPVLHARGTGGLAAAAGEAAVEVGVGLLACLAGFQQLLDQVDAPAGAVALVPRCEIGGAGGQAEAAVDAGTDQLTGPFARLARGVSRGAVLHAWRSPCGAHALCLAHATARHTGGRG